MTYRVERYDSCNIIIIHFFDRREMNKSMVRIQESYESPDFRGKPFRIKDYKEKYRENYGTFDYNSSVYGMNYPAYILWPFRLGFFDPLTKREKKILKDLEFATDKDYIISYAIEDDEGAVCNHELAHAFYFLYEDYRAKIDSVLNSVDLKNIYKLMYHQDYHKNVWMDESHAWLMFQWDEIEEDVEDLRYATSVLRKTFDSYKSTLIG